MKYISYMSKRKKQESWLRTQKNNIFI